MPHEEIRVNGWNAEVMLPLFTTAASMMKLKRLGSVDHRYLHNSNSATFVHDKKTKPAEKHSKV